MASKKKSMTIGEAIDSMADPFEKHGLRILRFWGIYDLYPSWQNEQKEKFERLLLCSKLLWGKCDFELSFLQSKNIGYKEMADLLLSYSSMGQKLMNHLDALDKICNDLERNEKPSVDIAEIEQMNCPHKELLDDAKERFDENDRNLKKKYGTAHGIH